MGCVRDVAYQLSHTGSTVSMLMQGVLSLSMYLMFLFGIWIGYQLVDQGIQTNVVETIGAFELMTADIFTHRSIRNQALSVEAHNINSQSMNQLATTIDESTDSKRYE